MGVPGGVWKLRLGGSPRGDSGPGGPWAVSPIPSLGPSDSLKEHLMPRGFQEGRWLPRERPGLAAFAPPLLVSGHLRRSRGAEGEGGLGRPEGGRRRLGVRRVGPSRAEVEAARCYERP